MIFYYLLGQVRKFKIFLLIKKIVVLLKQIIIFVSNSTESSYLGFAYVLGMFAASSLQSILLHQYFFIVYNIGMEVSFLINY